MPGVAQMICVGAFVQLISMQWLHLSNEQTLVCCMMPSSLKLKSAAVPVTQVLCPRPYFTCSQYMGALDVTCTQRLEHQKHACNR